MTIRNSVPEVPVSLLIGDEVVHIPADANLLAVSDELSAREIGMLVVGTKESIVGVVSERDVVHALAARRDPMTTTAGDIAHSKLIWCDVDASIVEVAREMMEHYVRHVLVEKGGRLVGVVSARDLLGAFASDDDDLGTDES